MRDNAGVTLAGRQPRAMCGECSIHRMFRRNRRQRVGLIENDRLFDVGLPRFPPLTPFVPHPPVVAGLRLAVHRLYIMCLSLLTYMIYFPNAMAQCSLFVL